MTIVKKLNYSLIFREKLNNNYFIVLAAVKHGEFSIMNIFCRSSPVVTSRVIIYPIGICSFKTMIFDDVATELTLGL